MPAQRGYRDIPATVHCIVAEVWFHESLSSCNPFLIVKFMKMFISVDKDFKPLWSKGIQKENPKSLTRGESLY